MHRKWQAWRRTLLAGACVLAMLAASLVPPSSVSGNPDMEAVLAHETFDDQNVSKWRNINPTTAADHWVLAAPGQGGVGYAYRSNRPVNNTFISNKTLLTKDALNANWTASEYSVEASFQIQQLSETQGRVGLLTRGRNNDNHYFAYYNHPTRKVEIWRRSGASNLKLAESADTVDILAQQYARMRMETFNVYQEGKLAVFNRVYLQFGDGPLQRLVEAFDTDSAGYLHSGQPGLYTASAQVDYDNVKVETIGLPEGEWSAYLSPEVATYDKDAGSVDHRDVTVQANLLGNTLTGIARGSQRLQSGSDYTAAQAVHGKQAVTLHTSYLQTLPMGDERLSFQFSNGQSMDLLLTVADSSIRPPEHLRLYGRPSAQIPATPLYKVRAEGFPVFAYDVKINPTSQYQDVSAPAGMAYFDSDFSKPVAIEVTASVPVQSVRIHPLSRHIQPSVNGNTISFELKEAGQYVVEVNGSLEKPLFLFANPFETDAPAPNAPNVRYFGPGVHNVGEIVLNSNETLYLAGGAFVNGHVRANFADNIAIRGRGILHGGTFARESMGSRKFIIVSNGSNIKIEGLILLDSFNWNINLNHTKDALIDNVKIVGWRRNSDGIDPVSAENLIVRNSFVKSQDDGVTIKGSINHHGDRQVGSIRNVLVENMVMWQNWMRSFVLGGELHVKDIENVVFRNSDIIYSGLNPNSQDNRDGALSIWNIDAAAVRDVLFENIRVQKAERLVRIGIVKNQFSSELEYGTIHGVTLRNISVSEGPALIEITGRSPEHDVRDILFENLWYKGSIAKAPPEGYTANEFVSNVQFIETSQVAPASGSFDKNRSKWNDLDVTLQLNGNEFVGIRSGGQLLREHVDYLRKGNEIKLKKQFLDQLPVGLHNIVFDVNRGTDPVFEVTVVHSSR